MDKSLAKEAAASGSSLSAHLEDGKMAKSYVTDDEDEQAILKQPIICLLISRPSYAANVAEDDLADDGAGNAGVQTGT